MKFEHRRDRRRRQCLRSRASVVGQSQVSAPRRKSLCSGDSVYARARTSASGWQHMRQGDNVCRVGGVIFYKLSAVIRNVCVQATMSTLGRRRLPHAFMNKADFACPNCKYDKKEFLEPVQKIGNLKINPPMGPVHLKSTRPENRFQL